MKCRKIENTEQTYLGKRWRRQSQRKRERIIRSYKKVANQKAVSGISICGGLLGRSCEERPPLRYSDSLSHTVSCLRVYNKNKIEPRLYLFQTLATLLTPPYQILS